MAGALRSACRQGTVALQRWGSNASCGCGSASSVCSVTLAATIRTAMEHSTTRSSLEAEKRRLEAIRDGAHPGGGVGKHSERDDLSELSGNDQHQAEVGTETFDRERDLSIVEQLESELEDVERALEKLDRGDYGLCEICSEPIASERLGALPATRFCLLHEQVAESGNS